MTMHIFWNIRMLPTEAVFVYRDTSGRHQEYIKKAQKKRRMICREHIYFALLLLVNVAPSNAETKARKTEEKTPCLMCSRYGSTNGEITAKCRISSRHSNCSQDMAVFLKNISALDLSDNRLTEVASWIFPWCNSIRNLSLSRNNIKEIKPGTFKYLGNLKTLNLSFNDLHEWRVDRNNELQSLNDLDLTGNENRLPSDQLLQLKKLRTVRGITWSKYCRNCALVKRESGEVNSSSKSTCQRFYKFSLPRGWEWHDQVQYGKALEFIKVGFWPTCLCDDACYIHQHILPLFQRASDVNLKAFCSLYATGSVALLVNIIVVLIIACNKYLRVDLAVCLILNIAFCDALIGLFSVLYATFNPSIIYIDYIYDILEGNVYDVFSKAEKLRNIMGPILTCAVASQVCGSFILTLEKFLKIVFAMKPEARIERKGVIIFLTLSWLLSVTFAVLPAFGVGQMSYSDDDLSNYKPLPTDQRIESNDMKTRVGIAASTQIALIIVQITSLVLYVPIFIVAKRSGANLGIKREATVAKKVALLVFTNIIFFTVPVVLGVFQSKIWSTFGQIMFQEWKDHTFTEYQWIGFAIFALPVWCVSINSVLNPFLFALRHPKIKQQLRRIIFCCGIVLSECFEALGRYFRCCPNSVQPEVELTCKT